MQFWQKRRGLLFAGPPCRDARPYSRGRKHIHADNHTYTHTHSEATQRTQRTQHKGRNAMNATDGTDATTDEASDRPFGTPSFILNIKLLGVCVNCDYFLFTYFIRSRWLEFVLLRCIKLQKQTTEYRRGLWLSLIIRTAYVGYVCCVLFVLHCVCYVLSCVRCVRCVGWKPRLRNVHTARQTEGLSVTFLLLR